jgi:hypothetical protein
MTDISVKMGASLPQPVDRQTLRYSIPGDGTGGFILQALNGSLGYQTSRLKIMIGSSVGCNCSQSACSYPLMFIAAVKIPAYISLVHPRYEITLIQG